MNKKNLIVTNLNEYKYEDIYTLMLFVLSELRNVPEYKTLSECTYILDKDSLVKFLQYFGGMTITVPTIDDLQLVIDTLLLYQYINEEGLEFEEAMKILKECNGPYKVHDNEIKTCYAKLVQILSKYDFKR